MKHKTLLDRREGIQTDDYTELFGSIRRQHIVFFRGDLGSGKSTFIRNFLRHELSDESLIVRSPTYTYYQQYGDRYYHFDLYRLENREEFFLIGGQDIIEDPNSLCLIEWPERLENMIIPDREIILFPSSRGDEYRDLEIYGYSQDDHN